MVYDCFTFFNEFNLLDIRLELLNDVVDKFVIVEADKTQRGKTKEFNFEKRRKEYEEKYKNKITYVKVTDCPILKNSKDWSIEYFQRNSILRGVVCYCKPDDLIMISDIDEIPNPDVIKNPNEYSIIPINKTNKNRKIHLKQFFALVGENKNFLKPASLDFFLEYMSVSLEQTLFYYFMDNKADSKWYGTVLCKFKNLRVPQQLRNRRQIQPYVENAGWHFSYLGGIEEIKRKLNSIIEGDNFKIPRGFSSEDEYINHCLKTGADIFGRRDMTFKFVTKNKIGLPTNFINDLEKKYPIYFHKETL